MLRTKSGLPKHCSWNTDHHGKRRVRFRKAGFTIYLTGTPWGEAFMRAYAAALDGLKAQTTGERGAARTIPGSLNALCVSYYRSPDFKALRSSTQVMRRYIIESFRKEHGNNPVNRLAPQAHQGHHRRQVRHATCRQQLAQECCAYCLSLPSA